MNKTLLNLEFNLAEIIQILKCGKTDLDICRKLTLYVLEVVDVAYLKLDLLIKANRKIEALTVAENLVADKLLLLEGLCERSHELFHEIQQLPLLQGNPDILRDLLALPRISRRYSDLLLLLYRNAKYIMAYTNPVAAMSKVQVK